MHFKFKNSVEKKLKITIDFLKSRREIQIEKLNKLEGQVAVLYDSSRKSKCERNDEAINAEM